MITFSVIMPSYLGPYRHAAKDRDLKIMRAIESVLSQSYREFELIVIADGCRETEDILMTSYLGQEKIRAFRIDKQPNFSGNVRNAGIKKAVNDWVVYLDIDDMFGKDHLKVIAEGITANPGYDWYWFNDRSYSHRDKGFNEHFIDIDRKGKNGTSNVCHRRNIGVWWPERGTYMHDWIFINKLKIASVRYKKLPTPYYLICHVPGMLDV